ncbi:MAG TPA: hypothetical protein ENJ60_14900 [Aeromonadales bacterium]|nr:hypothetical protein [Aeromonadales bacterium]
MNQGQYQNWSKLRKNGAKHFIWFRGVLAWGLLTAILWSGLMPVLYPVGNNLQRFLIALLLFPMGGFFWGLWVWKINEKKYLATKSEEQKD